MIFDTFDGLGRYELILPYADRIQAFLSQEELLSLEVGDIPLEGADLWVKVLRYRPAPSEEGSFEMHRRHADVQCVIRGCEEFEVSDAEQLEPVTEYDDATDFQFFEDPREKSQLRLRQGHFVIVFPGEPHKPGCRSDGCADEVLKLVFKIRMP